MSIAKSEDYALGRDECVHDPGPYRERCLTAVIDRSALPEGIARKLQTRLSKIAAGIYADHVNLRIDIFAGVEDRAGAEHVRNRALEAIESPATRKLVQRLLRKP